MIELSDESKRLVSTFLTHRNDIDIYTEDELKDKEFYKVLFSRLIDNKIRINDITPLGSRKNLISRCQNEPLNDRKKIFIIDGDISIIHGGNVPNLENLFVLDAYCIENYLFDKDNIIQFIYLNCGIKSVSEIEDELQFDNWLEEYTDKLIDLFIHFAIVDYFGGRFNLCNAQRFHKGNEFFEELVDNYIKDLKEDIFILTEKENYENKYAELRNLWSSCNDNLLTIVSGKDYLIPILLFKTQLFKKSKALPSIEETKLLLVQNCKLVRLQRLKNAIETL